MWLYAGIGFVLGVVVGYLVRGLRKDKAAEPNVPATGESSPALSTEDGADAAAPSPGLLSPAASRAAAQANSEPPAATDTPASTGEEDADLSQAASQSAAQPEPELLPEPSAPTASDTPSEPLPSEAPEPPNSDSPTPAPAGAAVQAELESQSEPPAEPDPAPEAPPAVSEEDSAEPVASPVGSLATASPSEPLSPVASRAAGETESEPPAELQDPALNQLDDEERTSVLREPQPEAAWTPGPYPNSALPTADGAAPAAEFTIKAKADSKLFHTEASPYYRRVKPDVWFRTEADAVAAGFTGWVRRPRNGAR